MAQQTKVKKAPKKTKTKPEEEIVEEVDGNKKTGVATVDVIDDWLDEIDDILEECEAAEFVRNYVQKGGE